MRPSLGPDRRLALEEYRRNAPTYDAETAFGDACRRRAVHALALEPGEAVADVGCGTGRNFAFVEEGIGSAGRIIGVDLCPEMLAIAHARVADHGWRNVTLLSSPAEEAELPAVVDAALFCAAHDVMRAPRALETILRQLRPGGRVVAVGPSWVPPLAPWAPFLNSCTWEINRRYVTTWEGFDRPWSHLERLVPDLEVETVLFGAGYLAVGTVPRRRVRRQRP
jgi:demethylmenaquinone methyltransferase/2-methoxy-6-polyprenyl-1,4-benzoquinol methylase